MKNKVLVLLLLTIMTYSWAESPILIDFESGVGDWGYSATWPSNGYVFFSQNCTISHSGSCSMQITITTESTYSQVGIVISLVTNFTNASFWYYNVPGISGNPFAYLYKNDCGGSSCLFDAPNSLYNADGTNVWIQKNLTNSWGRNKCFYVSYRECKMWNWKCSMYFFRG
jgi:hypothetical protein